jgi:hypothetical protein
MLLARQGVNIIYETRNKPCTVKKIEARWCNHYYSSQAISVTYFECVIVALGIQRAIRTSHIILLF